MTTSQACFIFPVTGIWAYLEGSYAWTPPALLGAAAGVLIFSGFLAFMKSVRLGEASVSTPIYRISFVITALVAILFLGEGMTPRKGGGFMLAAGSIFLLSDFRLRGGKAPPGRAVSILFAAAAMAAVGLLNIVYKLGVMGGVAPAMFLHSQAVFFIAIAFAYSWIVQGGPRFSRTGWAHALVTGVCLTVGIISLLAAFRRGEASVVAPIAQLSFVVTSMMATFWMGERLTGRKVAGLLLAVGTIVAFAPA